MNIEQIILQSKVTGSVPDRLKSVPEDQLDIRVMLAELVEIISPHFEHVRVDGDYRIKSIIGKLNEEKILWRREFYEALPPLKSKKDYSYYPDKNPFGFILDGKEYLFNKANGSYLGCFHAIREHED